MASLNKVQLIGYLGANPEKKVTSAGTSVVSINLATTNYYKDQMGQSQSSTDWHRLVFWKNLADNIAAYTKKGSLVYIEGRLQTREWTKDDIRRFTTEVVVGKLQFLEKKSQTESTDAGSYETSQNNNYTTSNQQSSNSLNSSEQPTTNDFIEDADIPF